MLQRTAARASHASPSFTPPSSYVVSHTVDTHQFIAQNPKKHCTQHASPAQPLDEVQAHQSSSGNMALVLRCICPALERAGALSPCSSLALPLLPMLFPCSSHALPLLFPCSSLALASRGSSENGSRTMLCAFQTNVFGRGRGGGRRGGAFLCSFCRPAFFFFFIDSD